MSSVFDTLRHRVTVTKTEHGWKINSLGTSFLDWMRKNYADEEDKSWQLWYYSGSMAIIEVIEERMMTMIQLRWT